MEWHDIRDPNDPQLDALATRYGLHPLHIEDCRHGGQNAKVEEQEGYLFAVLKPLQLDEGGVLEFSDLDVFLGKNFIITVQESACQPLGTLLDDLRASLKNKAPTDALAAVSSSTRHHYFPHYAGEPRTDHLFYRIADGVVDGYLPALDYFDDLSDSLDEEVLANPSPEVLDRIFSAKRSLIQLRRVLANTRDVTSHLQRSDSEFIGQDLWPFLRDLYDHVARNLDTVEVQRDLLSGAMEIYLSAQAQRTNLVMKVLTVLGTIALPALVISGIYGMNLHGLPWADNPRGGWDAIALMGATTMGLLFLLHKMDWL
jgi:magnesium transporter